MLTTIFYDFKRPFWICIQTFTKRLTSYCICSDSTLPSGVSMGWYGGHTPLSWGPNCVHNITCI